MQNADTSTTKPSALRETNMSEMASPAAVVEILITQKRAVTSGTFAANGCWLNTLRNVRTLWLSPCLGGSVSRSVGRTSDGARNRAAAAHGSEAVQPATGIPFGSFSQLT